MTTLEQAFAGKRVLVTGHTGFKGSWLSTWLAQLGSEVTGVALEPYTDPAMFDLLGLDTVYHVAEHLRESYGDSFYVHEGMKDLVEQGKLTPGAGIGKVG